MFTNAHFEIRRIFVPEKTVTSGHRPLWMNDGAATIMLGRVKPEFNIPRPGIGARFSTANNALLSRTFVCREALTAWRKIWKNYVRLTVSTAVTFVLMLKWERLIVYCMRKNRGQRLRFSFLKLYFLLLSTHTSVFPESMLLLTYGKLQMGQGMTAYMLLSSS